MAERYLHINYNPMEGWVYPILNRLNSAGLDLQKRKESWEAVGLGDLAIAISTKLKVLSLAIVRANERLHAIGRELEDIEQVRKYYDGGFAFRLKDDNLAFELLVDLDSFIFESRSTYEILGKFIRDFFYFILDKKVSEADLIAILRKNHIDTEWIEVLAESRKYFFHNGAPWIGFRPLDNDYASLELLMLKKTVKELETDADYVPFRKLKDIYINFSSSLNALQEFLISEIGKFKS